MQKPTRDDLRKAFEVEPTLTDFGMGIYQQKRYKPDEAACKIEADRADILTNDRFLRMFQVCCAWLSLCKTRKTTNRKVGTSYALKHRAERYFGEYVTNGAFIAAVIHMGIPYKTFPNFPNIEVALSSRGLPRDTQSTEGIASLDTFDWGSILSERF